jgi:hypothetical protein
MPTSIRDHWGITSESFHSTHRHRDWHPKFTFVVQSDYPWTESLAKHSKRTGPSAPIERSDDEVRYLFGKLRKEWLTATAAESSFERIILYRSYQQIIGLGPQVVPLILEDLAQTSNDWFWALMAIVGEDKAHGETTVSGAVQAWLSWGRDLGLIDG